MTPASRDGFDISAAVCTENQILQFVMKSAEAGPPDVMPAHLLDVRDGIELPLRETGCVLNSL